MNVKFHRLQHASVALAFAVGALCFGQSALAATATANLSVSADVINSCSISTSAVSFGSYDPIAGSDNTASGNVTLTCTPDASTAVTLGQGLHADTGSSDAAPARRMSDGTNYVSYNLYTDNTYGTVWDNASGVAYTGTGSADVVNVYGKMLHGQLSAPAGHYTDTIVATITF